VLTVSIVVPAYRDLPLLDRSIPVLLENSPAKTEVVLVNNDRGQDLHEWALKRRYDVRVLDLGHNVGFSGAANAGIDATSGDLILVANDDLFLGPTYLPEMISLFQRRPAAGAANGKILRYDLELSAPTGTLDSAGIRIGRNRRPMDRGEGVEDRGEFEVETEVFAANGAAMVLRRRALGDARVANEYFDETFFMYKEDLDLSWRLRLGGWECWYVPRAVAYHARASKGLGEKSYFSSFGEFVRNEKTKPRAARIHSMKNQWLMLIKNEDAANLLRDLPHVLGRELMILGYNALFAPRTLVSIVKFLRVVRVAARKRQEIMAKRVTPAAELRRWFGRDG
jgi:GT2 family glycosyltransferase